MVSGRGNPSAVRRGYKLIAEQGSRSNWPSPDAPWVILLQHGRYSGCYTQVVKSDGYTFPVLGYHVRDAAHKSWGDLYLGKFRSKFHKKLPEILQYRDTLNLIHAIANRKARVTEEQLAAILDPHLRLKVVEAVCLANA